MRTMFVVVMVTFIGGVAAQGSQPLTEAIEALPSAVRQTEPPVQAISTSDVDALPIAEPQYAVRAAESRVGGAALPLADRQSSLLEAQPAILPALGQDARHADALTHAVIGELPQALGSEVQGEPLVPGPMVIVDPTCAFDGSGCIESAE